MQITNQLASFLVLLLKQLNSGIYITHSDGHSGDSILASVERETTGVCFLGADQISLQDLKMDSKRIKIMTYLDLTTNPYEVSERLLDLAHIASSKVVIYKIQLPSCSELDLRAEKVYNNTIDIEGERKIVFICKDSADGNMTNGPLEVSSKNMESTIRFSRKNFPFNRRFGLDNTTLDRCGNPVKFHLIDSGPGSQNLEDSLRSISRWSHNGDCLIRCYGASVQLEPEAPRLARDCKQCRRCAPCFSRRSALDMCHGKGCNFSLYELQTKKEEEHRMKLWVIPLAAALLAGLYIMLQFYLVYRQNRSWFHNVHGHILTVVLISEMILASSLNQSNYNHTHCNTFYSLEHFRFASSGLVLPRAKLRRPSSTSTTTSGNIVLIISNYFVAVMLCLVRLMFFFEPSKDPLRLCIANNGAEWLVAQISITLVLNIVLLIRNKTSRNNLIQNMLVGFAFGLCGQAFYLMNLRNQSMLLDNAYVIIANYAYILIINFYAPVIEIISQCNNRDKVQQVAADEEEDGPTARPVGQHGGDDRIEQNPMITGRLATCCGCYQP